MENRFRLFSLVLYEDTESYDIKEIIKNIKGYKYYVYIKHNKDIKDDGSPKKLHYHVIIKLDNATTIKALSKKIGIPDNYIQNIRNERAYIRYLIHFDDEDKAQYDFDNLVMSRSYQRHIKKCFDDKETEEQIINNINIFINENAKKYNRAEFMYALIQYVNTNCYETIYKRYRPEFNNLISFMS